MNTETISFNESSIFLKQCNNLLQRNANYNLPHLGLIAVNGPDAEAFLFKQFTSDLKLVTPYRSQLSGYCSPKGRLLAIFRIFQRENIFYISLPRELLDPTLKRLKMFVLMAKVTLTDASEALQSIGLAGADCQSLLATILGDTPKEIEDVLLIEGITVLKLPGHYPRFQLIGQDKDLSKMTEQLAHTTITAPSSQWELIDILAGLPVILPDTVEEFIPQMVNLHLLGGVSFKKGCYPGQEIVARTQYLGKLKRHMYLGFTPTVSTIRPGESIYTAAPNDSQKVGTVLNAQICPDHGTVLLAVVETTAAASGDLNLHTPDAVELKLSSLPYATE